MTTRAGFVERSAQGKCFSLGCSRKPKFNIVFNNQQVRACKGHKDADGLFTEGSSS